MHVQLLREAVEADERITPYDDLDEGARSLVEDVMEKQWQVVSKSHTVTAHCHGCVITLEARLREGATHYVVTVRSTA